ncbi:FliO/MopB family protein [Aquincola tertiaricarbonis]|uniref:FliO/MopB family protein n=1 Tax=Aquincola tertiaricarbonis TaxID=391953 RepID=UPI000615414C|nr:flagellar biosynthetic protein FliO [Aquincola tertiaricarbonis]
MNTSLSALLWFIAVLALIPVALWLLKRSPMGQAALGPAPMRTIASISIAQNQRIVTVEVGQGEERRWLVLGATPQSITTLYTMAPQADAPASPAAGQVAAPFAQLMARLSPHGLSKGAPKDGPGHGDVF